MQCVNLRERFGRYYVVNENRLYTKQRGTGQLSDPWQQVLLCRNGHICPWGNNLLAACTVKSGQVAKRLKALPFTTVAQDGDDGANVVFPVEHFEEVAAIMKPRRRRRLSERQWAAAVERLRKYQPTKGQSVKDIARQCRKTARTGVPIPCRYDLDLESLLLRFYLAVGVLNGRPPVFSCFGGGWLLTYYRNGRRRRMRSSSR
jgi:hypothetical protein